MTDTTPPTPAPPAPKKSLFNWLNKTEWTKKKLLLTGGGILVGLIIISNLGTTQAAETVADVAATPVAEPVEVEVIAEPEPEPEPEPEAVAEPGTTLNMAELFDLTLMLSDDPVFQSAGTREAAVEVATTFCESLDDGLSVETASLIYIGLTEENGVTINQLGTILGAGVPAFCPQHEDAMNAFYESR